MGTMLSKKHIKDEISSHSVLIRQYGISKIGLFGSFARQEQTNGSDIDILIDFQQDKETFDNFMAVCDLLDTIFKGYKVDVVTAGGLSPYIGPHILKDVEYVQITNWVPSAYLRRVRVYHRQHIAGMRDKLIHDYIGVNYAIVWDVIRNKIPEIKPIIAQIIDSELNK